MRHGTIADLKDINGWLVDSAHDRPASVHRVPHGPARGAT